MKLRDIETLPEARYLNDDELLLAALGGSRNKALIPKIAKLLTTYQSLTPLLRMDIGELAIEHELGYPRAVQVQAILEIAKRLYDFRVEKEERIMSAMDAVRCVRSDLSYLDHEEMRVLLLDIKHHPKANILLYQGTVNASVIRIAEILRPAIVQKYPVFVLFHCHPSGDPRPSPEDLAVTKQLVEAGKLLDIELLDHIIISGHNNYCSLKEQLRWD